MMSINAAKAVEIGAGLEAAAMRGEDAADEMRLGEDGQPAFKSNHNGGVLGRHFDRSGSGDARGDQAH
jgi:chorismate synthase